MKPIVINKLSIVIPAYNEAKTVHGILNKISDVQLINNIEKEIIIINDCSTDETEETILQYAKQYPSLNIQYIKHDVNRGKGASLHSGIQKATGEYLVVQDADLEYDPDEYNLLLKPVLNGMADV